MEVVGRFDQAIGGAKVPLCAEQKSTGQIGRWGGGEWRRTVGPWDAREAPVSRQLVGQLEGADAHATPYRAGGLDAVAGRRVLDGVPVKQPVLLTPAENGPG